LSESQTAACAVPVAERQEIDHRLHYYEIYQKSPFFVTRRPSVIPLCVFAPLGDDFVGTALVFSEQRQELTQRRKDARD
jgi:hypothetical protein